MQTVEENLVWKLISYIFQWRLFIIISRASKWGTLKSAVNPRCAVHAEIHSICTARPRPGPAASVRVSPTSDTCQSVAILMNRRHYTKPTKLNYLRKFLLYSTHFRTFDSRHETGPYKLIFVLSRASKQNGVQKKFSYRIKFRSFFSKVRKFALYSRKFSSAKKFVKSDRRALRQKFIFVKRRPSLVRSLLCCFSFFFTFKNICGPHFRFCEKL